MFYKIQNTFSNSVTMYIIQTHINNLVLTHSRAEVEAAIVLLAVNRPSRNVSIALVFSNLVETYSKESLLESASVMGFCTLDKVS